MGVSGLKGEEDVPWDLGRGVGGMADLDGDGAVTAWDNSSCGVDGREIVEGELCDGGWILFVELFGGVLRMEVWSRFGLIAHGLEIYEYNKLSWKQSVCINRSVIKISKRLPCVEPNSLISLQYIFLAKVYLCSLPILRTRRQLFDKRRTKIHRFISVS